MRWYITNATSGMQMTDSDQGLPDQNTMRELSDRAIDFLDSVKRLMRSGTRHGAVTYSCPDAIIELVNTYGLYTELAHVLKQNAGDGLNASIVPRMHQNKIVRIDVSLRRD